MSDILKGYIYNIKSIVLKFIEDYKYKFRHIAESNEELCFFYMFSENYNDLAVRIKFLKKFYNNYAGFKFFEGILKLYRGNKESAKADFASVVKAMPDHKIANFYLNALTSDINELDTNVLNEKFADIATVYSKVNKNAFNEYYNQLKSNSNFIRQDKDVLNILDIGCKNGWFTAKIAPILGKKLDITAIENSEKMIDIASKIKKSSEDKFFKNIFTYSIESFFKDNNQKFDVIMSFDYLNTYNNEKYLLSEAFKNISDTGVVVLGFEFDNKLPEKQMNILKLKYLYNFEYIKKIAMDTGFRVVSDNQKTAASFAFLVLKKS